jgi:hypothetical protein
MRCDCEDCGDRQACDIYYAEKGFSLLEARFEEDWKEREHAKREGL